MIIPGGIVDDRTTLSDAAVLNPKSLDAIFYGKQDALSAGKVSGLTRRIVQLTCKSDAKKLSAKAIGTEASGRYFSGAPRVLSRPNHSDAPHWYRVHTLRGNRLLLNSAGKPVEHFSNAAQLARRNSLLR